LAALVGALATVTLPAPGQFRAIDDLVKNETQGGGSMELLSLKEVRDDEEKFE
jgi:hypothetical protein